MTLSINIIFNAEKIIETEACEIYQLSVGDNCIGYVAENKFDTPAGIETVITPFTHSGEVKPQVDCYACAVESLFAQLTGFDTEYISLNSTRAGSPLSTIIMMSLIESMAGRKGLPH